LRYLRGQRKGLSFYLLRASLKLIFFCVCVGVESDKITAPETIVQTCQPCSLEKETSSLPVCLCVCMSMCAHMCGQVERKMCVCVTERESEREFVRVSICE
jgi:hypothetical protein